MISAFDKIVLEIIPKLILLLRTVVARQPLTNSVVAHISVGSVPAEGARSTRTLRRTSQEPQINGIGYQRGTYVGKFLD